MSKSTIRSHSRQDNFSKLIDVIDCAIYFPSARPFSLLATAVSSFFITASNSF